MKRALEPPDDMTVVGALFEFLRHVRREAFYTYF